MFWALNGATDLPVRESDRPRAAVTVDLPAPDVEPTISRAPPSGSDLD